MIQFSDHGVEDVRSGMAGVANLLRFVQLCLLGGGAVRHCGNQ